MASELNGIIAALKGGKLTLESACKTIADASRADPVATRMWGLLLKGHIARGNVTQAAGHELLDALEAFQPARTLWLGPKKMKTVVAPKVVTVDAPAPEAAPPKPALDKASILKDPEQLRAFLWSEGADRAATEKPPKNTADIIPLPTAAPPRLRPGVENLLPEFEVGTVIQGRYRLDHHLGYGGIGQVYSATDLAMERAGVGDSRLTLKMIAVDLNRQPEALPRIHEVVERNRTLRHPNIVAMHGVETHENRLFVTMESLSGSWLGTRIRSVRNVGLASELAWPIVASIAEGLAYAHRQGIVHADLSPYSVFITERGIPKIMGFGLVRALPTSNEAIDLLDTMTSRAYSEAYTANAWSTHGTPKAGDDLYPLGVIAYELLTGAHPFQRHSLSAARQKSLAWAPIPALNPRALKLLTRCLSFDRDARPVDAMDFLQQMHGPAVLRRLFGARFSVLGATEG